jgi:hypothetical protein
MTEVAGLDAQLTELEAAIRVLERYGEGEGRESAAGSDVGESRVHLLPHRMERLGRGTQKALIKGILRPDVGMNASDIHQEILERHGIAVSVNTISVTLPRLKNEGFARLDGRQWFRVSVTETAGPSSTEIGLHSISTG